MKAARKDKPRRATLRTRLLLALGTIVFWLLTAEAGLRVTRHYTTSPTTHPELVVHDDVLGWAYRPGASIRHRSAEFDVEVRIDADGFREWPHTAAQQPPAIWVLGDSFAFGWGVPAEDSFPALLEAGLQQHVLGAGVSGTGTDQQLLLYRRLREHSPLPQCVILQVCGNDFEEVRHLRRYGHGKPRFRLSEGAPTSAAEAVSGTPSASGPAETEPRLQLEGVPVPSSRLERSSALFRWLRQRWDRVQARAPSEAEHREGQELVAALIRQLDREVRADGAQLLVVHEGNTGLEALLEQGEPPVDSLDLQPALEAREQADGPTHFPLDGHWNAQGHAAVAEAIARWWSVREGD